MSTIIQPILRQFYVPLAASPISKAMTLHYVDKILKADQVEEDSSLDSTAQSPL